ncbi:uncharacterized protein LOC118435937 [Folsomia candida]|uniref:uncharacterized protein LOC118435937 n=1 Tax=Folsomia candida TaxID=158441 RepID=UPI001604DC27|nr:uncharacterized protein LOC118435937 [Folsomia candida]
MEGLLHRVEKLEQVVTQIAKWIHFSEVMDFGILGSTKVADRISTTSGNPGSPQRKRKRARRKTKSGGTSRHEVGESCTTDESEIEEEVINVTQNTDLITTNNSAATIVEEVTNLEIVKVEDYAIDVNNDDDANNTTEGERFTIHVDHTADYSPFELECLRNQSVLLGRMETIESLLLTSLQNKNDADVVSRSWIWPLKTEQEMNKVELWLQQDERHYQHEVLALSKIGGTSESKCVYNTLQWTIAHELALNLRFTNKSGKTSFGDKLIAQLIRDTQNLRNAIKAGSSDVGLTDAKINGHIASWLRQSAEREKSRNKKIAE